MPASHLPSPQFQRPRGPRAQQLAWARGKGWSVPGSPERATAQPKVTEPRGTHQARDGCPFSSPALLTSLRLRSAGCSRIERLSRYCHRGLSSGGSRCRCRRNRHEGHRLPAREREDQGLGLWDTGGQPEPRPSARNRGLCSSLSLRVRPSARPPARWALPRLQQPDPAHPGRGQWRKRRPARPSPGPAWRAKRAGVQAGSWRGWETAADHVRWSHQGQTLMRGRLGSTLLLPCPRNVASGAIWRPHSLTTSSAQDGPGTIWWPYVELRRGRE